MTKSVFTRRLQVCLPIVVGGMIYTLFGSRTLWIFDWYSQLGLTSLVTTARGFTADLRPLLPAWVLYSLPDGLWSYAYTSLMANIWRSNSSSADKVVWLFSGVILAICAEFGQFLGLVVGTFDVIDIYFYSLGFLLALLLRARSDMEEVDLCAK